MNAFIVIFVCIASFLFGFLLGCVDEPSVRKEKDYKKYQNSSDEQDEFDNFLLYDGSEQN